MGISVTQNPNDLTFTYELTLDEARRWSAVLEAIGDDWDPIHVLAEEELAWDMLYSVSTRTSSGSTRPGERGRAPGPGGDPCYRLTRTPTGAGARGCRARAATTSRAASNATAAATAALIGSTC